MTDEEPKTKLGSRTWWLIVLGLVALVIAARLVSRWLKWLLVLVAVAGLAYALFGRSDESDSDSSSNPS